MCFGPSAVAVMNGSEMDVCKPSARSQPRRHDIVSSHPASGRYCCSTPGRKSKAYFEIKVFQLFHW